MEGDQVMRIHKLILILAAAAVLWVALVFGAYKACAGGDCFGRRCLNAAVCCPSAPSCIGQPAQWGHCQ